MSSVVRMERYVVGRDVEAGDVVRRRILFTR
jgi:hypothetical protein